MALALATVLIGASLPGTASASAAGDVPTAPSSPALTTAFVPVQRFWSTRRDISRDEVRAAVAGESATFSRVVVASEIRPGCGPRWT